MKISLHEPNQTETIRKAPSFEGAFLKYYLDDD
jgi:hypothetical protein